GEALDPLYAARSGTIPALAAVLRCIPALHRLDHALLTALVGGGGATPDEREGTPGARSGADGGAGDEEEERGLAGDHHDELPAVYRRLAHVHVRSLRHAVAGPQGHRPGRAGHLLRNRLGAEEVRGDQHLLVAVEPRRALRPRRSGRA